MAVKEICLWSFILYGLLLDVSKGQKAQYGTSKWNQNVHRHRTTSEPSLGAFDRVNTTDVPEEFEPVTNVRGVIINKPLPGQEMYNNVLNPGDVATNRRRMNKVHLPQKQSRKRTTPEPRLGTFDRINTTDVPEEFEPVTNYKGIVINKPVHGQEMYNDITAPGQAGVNRTEGSQRSWNKIQSQHRTTVEPRLGAFDRINTTDVPEEFEPVTNGKGVVINKPLPGQEMHNDAFRSGQAGVNRTEGSQRSWNKIQSQHRTTVEPRLGAFDRINTTDVPEEFEPVTNREGVVINKPLPGQELHNDVFRSAYGPMDMLLKQGATKLQVAEGMSKQANQTDMVTTSTTKGSNSKGQKKALSINRKPSLKRQRLAEKEVEREETETETEEPQEEEQKQKQKQKQKQMKKRKMH